MVDEAAAVRWLRDAKELWWWRLPPDQFRIAIEIMASSVSEEGRRVLVTTTDRLAAQCGVDRGVIRRALAALSAGGFCTVAAVRGAGGSTTIGILPRGHSYQPESTEQVSNSGPTSTIGIRGRPFESAVHDHSQVSETVCVSSAIGGDHDHSKTTQPTIPGQILDLDQRSEDLSGRSTTPEILTSKESKPSTPEPKRSRKPRVDPDKISERAWAAADYMRGQIVEADPHSLFSVAQWGGRGGRRLAWANSMQRLHDGLARAANVLPLDAPATAAIWDDIARTVFWIYNRDPSRPNQGDLSRFVVESPDSLTTKWDKIQEVRRNQARATQARAAPRPGAPDSRPPPVFTSWGDK